MLMMWRIVFLAALLSSAGLVSGAATAMPAAPGEVTIPSTFVTPDHCIGECGRQQRGVGQADLSEFGVAASNSKPAASTKTLTMPLPGAFALFGSVLFGGIGVAKWRKRRDRGPVSVISSS